jgi:hypothetical protein
MKGIPTIKLKRPALIAGTVAVTAAASLLGMATANATVGTQPGTVSFNPSSGSTSLTPTWSTTVGCPSGFQGSAVLREVAADGTSTATVSQAINGTANAFSGTLFGTIAQLQANDSFPNGGTQEWAVICFSGASLTGSSQPYMDTWLTYSADGSTYTETNTPPAGPASTTTTLTASPNPAMVGQNVTLTATVSASGSTPSGSVQFQVGGTAIGSPVTVNASGVATTTTTFSAAGAQSLSAVFTPSSTSAYNSSTGTYNENVQAAGANSGSEPLAVSVPSSGVFTLTVATGTVNLAVSGSAAAGALNPITVSDTRNSYPGWSVSGQAADFAGSGTAAGGTISGNQLGWTPTDTSLAGGATLGGPVSPASPGLGSTAATLASAAAGKGFGSSGLGANLNLAIPGAAPAGPYASALTVTAVTSAP